MYESSASVVSIEPNEDAFASATTGESPFLPANLFLLFFQPTIFFTKKLGFSNPFNLIMIGITYGFIKTVNEINENVFRIELGNPRSGFEEVYQLLIDSWLNYWGFALIIGGIAGIFYWLINGWWFKIRTRFSGAIDPNPKAARQIYFYSTIIQSLPILLLTIWHTLRYPNFGTAYQESGSIEALMIIFPFWSAIIAYKGVRAIFVVNAWRARFWFIGLPWVVWLSAYIGLLFLLVGDV